MVLINDRFDLGSVVKEREALNRAITAIVHARRAVEFADSPDITADDLDEMERKLTAAHDSRDQAIKDFEAEPVASMFPPPNRGGARL